MATFGERLKDLRLDAGLTQSVIAERIGVSNTYISALESGRKPAPPQAIVTALAVCLGIDEQDLWSLAEQEREERLRDRIAGVPTSLRTARRPRPKPKATANTRRMEDAVRSIETASKDVRSRSKLADALERLAAALREGD